MDIQLIKKTLSKFEFHDLLSTSISFDLENKDNLILNSIIFLTGFGKRSFKCEDIKLIKLQKKGLLT